MFVNRDLFDDEDENPGVQQLQFQESDDDAPPSNQNNNQKYEQEIKQTNSDDDFDYDIPQKNQGNKNNVEKLPDFAYSSESDSDEDKGQNKKEPEEYKKNTQKTTQQEQPYYQNQNKANMDDFLYSSNNNRKNSDDWDRPVTGNTNKDPTPPQQQQKIMANARPNTSNRDAMMEKKKREIEELRKDSNQGLLAQNKMLRDNPLQTEDYNYENLSKIVGTNNSNIYDPSQRAYGTSKSNLPNLEKSSNVISYNKEVHNAPAYEPKKEDNGLKNFEQTSTFEESKPEEKEEDSSGDEQNDAEQQHIIDEQKKKEMMSKQEDAPVQSLPKPITNTQNKEEQKQGENQQQASQQPESKILTIDLREIIDVKQFLMRPCPKGAQIQCTIKRDRSGFARFFPKYHCFLSHGPQYLMTGKKRSGNKTSNYLISYKKDELKKKSLYFLGKVRSNFMGTEFQIYDGGQNPKKCSDPQLVRENLGVVLYESNLLGARGPRKMKVLVPEVKTTGEIYSFKPMNPKEGMLTNMKNNRLEGIKVYFNKPPKWNDQVQAYVLNFNGRVEKPSVKNFQLIDDQDEDRIYMQFGRVSNDTFNMDFEWPLSPYQAFAICLSSFDYKIACE